MARALAAVPRGGRIEVRGVDPNLEPHLAAWARAHGHRCEGREVIRGDKVDAAWRDATTAGDALARPERRAEPRWGLAPRGALVESGGPPLPADLLERETVWADLAPRLYAQAAASQWNPDTAVDWSAEFSLPEVIEAAVVQVMTYLVENETAALIVPGRFLGRVHPHFREVLQLLAVQVADEARHIEVFTRRALLGGGTMGRSGAGGRASLHTLLEEPDFSIAGFLLSVLGEGTFLNLLAFLDEHAPDPVTRQVAHLALQDEARHVAFGQGHLEHRVDVDPTLRGRLRAAVERRHDALARTAGLSEDVFDALILLAAGEFTPGGVASGWARVQRLQADMFDGRCRRLVRLGFPDGEAAELAGLHTRNFM